MTDAKPTAGQMIAEIARSVAGVVLIEADLRAGRHIGGWGTSPEQIREYEELIAEVEGNLAKVKEELRQAISAFDAAPR